MTRFRYAGLAIAAAGLAACGGDDTAEVRTVTVTEPSAQETPAGPPPDGDAILIRTRVSDGLNHVGEVRDGSMLGEEPFCPGGKTSGSSDGPTITSKFTCEDGTLTVHFAPIQRSSVQSSAWEIESGTGRYEGLRGGGWMVAAFEGDAGGETLTGTVAKD